MAKNKRLSAKQLAEQKRDFAGLKSIPNYSPVKAEFEVAAIETVETDLDKLLEKEAQILVQLGDVRDQIAAKGTEFVQKMNGAAQQVTAQFGDDSPELQAIGRIRKSERATRRPKAKNNKPD